MGNIGDVPFFRTIGAVTTSLAGAMTPSTILLLAMVIYTGFVIPKPSMLGWAKWITYINPVSYIFESIMVNEFYDRQFECSQYIPSGPGYENVDSKNKVCTAVGSVPGEPFVNGTNYLKYAYQYYNSTNGEIWVLLLHLLLYSWEFTFG